MPRPAAGGRQPKLDERQVEEVKRLMASPTIPVSQIAACCKVSWITLYKVARRNAAPIVESPPDVEAMMPHRQNAP